MTLSYCTSFCSASLLCLLLFRILPYLILLRLISLRRILLQLITFLPLLWKLSSGLVRRLGFKPVPQEILRWDPRLGLDSACSKTDPTPCLYRSYAW